MATTTYPEMNGQIVGILRATGSEAGRYAAVRIEELEAEVKRLRKLINKASTARDGGGLTMADDDKVTALRELIEAMRKQIVRQKAALLAQSREIELLAQQLRDRGFEPACEVRKLERCFEDA